MKKDQPVLIYTENKKALFDYEVLEEYEAGVKLYGQEVKSIRNGNVNLKWSYILIHKWKPLAVGIHIWEYSHGSRLVPAKREREILMKRWEILKLEIRIKELWATLIPLKIYSKGNLIKLKLGLARGKKLWQKKNTIKERDIDRENARKFRF